MKQTFRFYKTASERWFIDLPTWTGSVDDLEMVEGADIMLDLVSGHSNECYLMLSDQEFEGADVITLVNDLTESGGGGDYYMESYQGEQVIQSIWLCSVTCTVFNTLPGQIFVSVQQ